MKPHEDLMVPALGAFEPNAVRLGKRVDVRVSLVAFDDAQELWIEIG
jgi:hypothetical protein